MLIFFIYLYFYICILFLYIYDFYVYQLSMSILKGCLLSKFTNNPRRYNHIAYADTPLVLVFFFERVYNLLLKSTSATKTWCFKSIFDACWLTVKLFEIHFTLFCLELSFHDVGYDSWFATLKWHIDRRESDTIWRECLCNTVI